MINNSVNARSCPRLGSIFTTHTSRGLSFHEVASSRNSARLQAYAFQASAPRPNALRPRRKYLLPPRVDAVFQPMHQAIRRFVGIPPHFVPTGVAKARRR